MRQEGSPGPRAAHCRGCTRGSSGPPQSAARPAGARPWRTPSVLLSNGDTWLPQGPLGGARRHPGYPPDAPGFAGLPTTASSSCGIEFSTPSALRVSVPLGGKYKRCLCLKPNMGVRESPGLCPSLGPGLLATEGWAETRGRPPSYAQRGSCV